MTVYCVAVNQPGYSPDSDPIGCETLADARDCLASEIALTAETVDRFDGKAVALAEALATAETLQAGESVTFAGYAHTIIESAEAF